jgi:hypothetical protein
MDARPSIAIISPSGRSSPRSSWARSGDVLEAGSGTSQHAVEFAGRSGHHLVAQRL